MLRIVKVGGCGDVHVIKITGSLPKIMFQFLVPCKFTTIYNSTGYQTHVIRQTYRQNTHKDENNFSKGRKIIAKLGGWRDGLVVKNMYCSCKDSEVGSEHPYLVIPKHMYL